MDWVETTGPTIEEAIEQALLQLGVSEEDSDVVVLSEAKPGLFGRVRSEARIRARVRPVAPTDRENATKERQRGLRAPAPAETPSRPERSASAAAEAHNGRVTTVTKERWDRAGGELEVPLAEQAEVARQFLLGVLERMETSGRVDVTEIDDNTVEVAVTGGDLALLVGLRGATVDALQDLARVIVQRRTGARHGRLLVDVAGYRQRRRQALASFTRERAEEVLRDGVEQVLEPMGAADRKVIHDTANSMEGVRTHSEGEEPRRRVVISPA